MKKIALLIEVCYLLVGHDGNECPFPDHHIISDNHHSDNILWNYEVKLTWEKEEYYKIYYYSTNLIDWFYAGWTKNNDQLFPEKETKIHCPLYGHHICDYDMLFMRFENGLKGNRDPYKDPRVKSDIPNP